MLPYSLNFDLSVAFVKIMIPHLNSFMFEVNKLFYVSK